LQVDVAGENTLAKSSAVNGVARPSDAFVDIAHDDFAGRSAGRSWVLAAYYKPFTKGDC